jgi:hypothetical protein
MSNPGISRLPTGIEYARTTGFEPRKLLVNQSQAIDTDSIYKRPYPASLSRPQISHILAPAD